MGPTRGGWHYTGSKWGQDKPGEAQAVRITEACCRMRRPARTHARLASSADYLPELRWLTCRIPAGTSACTP